MKQANTILSGYGTTVFEVMSRLAIEHQSINLGQGFPDEDGPEDVRQAAADALMEGPNQYPPMLGIPELRQAVAAHGQHHYGLCRLADRSDGGIWCHRSVDWLYVGIDRTR